MDKQQIKFKEFTANDIYMVRTYLLNRIKNSTTKFLLFLDFFIIVEV